MKSQPKNKGRRCSTPGFTLRLDPSELGIRAADAPRPTSQAPTPCPRRPLLTATGNGSNSSLPQHLSATDLIVANAVAGGRVQISAEALAPQGRNQVVHVRAGAEILPCVF